MHSRSRVVVSGPLERFAAGFDAELARLGYARVSAYFQMRLAAQLSAWMARRRIDVAVLGDRDVVREFFSAAEATCVVGQTRPGIGALGPLLGYLRQLGVVAPETLVVPDGGAERLLADYRRYLSQERGLSRVTLGKYVPVAARFLATVPEPFDEQLAARSAAEVLEFVQGGQGFGPSRASVVTPLRAFLRFVFLRG